MSAIVLAAIFGICHGNAECIVSVKDLTPQSKEEVVLAYCSLHYRESPQCGDWWDSRAVRAR